MIKNIVFDMDGVLIDTEALFMRCWKKLAEAGASQCGRGCQAVYRNYSDAD